MDRENDEVVDGEILKVDRNNDAIDVEIRDKDSSTKGGRVRCIEEDDR